MPVHEKPEVFRKVEFLSEFLAEQFGHGVDLVDVAGGIEGPVEGGETFIFLSGVELRAAFGEQLRNRIAAEGGLGSSVMPGTRAAASGESLA